MSNKSKVSSVKKSKTKKNIKPVKTAKKQTATKKIASKTVTKKPASKSAVKKSNVKVAVKKSIALKKSIPKKAVKPVVKEKVKKGAVKKIQPKKVAITKKPVQKKTGTKKIVIKTTPKKVEITKQKTVKEQKPVKEITKVAKAIVKDISSVIIKETKKTDAASKKNQKDPEAYTDVLAISNTIPQKEKVEISLSKIASISSSITNPIKKTDSYAIKPEKEPSGKFELEFIVHASADMLYEFLSTPSGLSEWFCDDVNIRNGIYTFIWDGQMQQARLLKTVDVILVRFQWVDKNDGSYFEFRIQRDDLTNDISLIITDFAETNSDRESAKLLWGSQVEKLMHVIGSIF